MDVLRVHVEPKSDAVSASDRGALAAALSNKIKAMLGISAEVAVGDPGTVAHSEGKAKRVVDKPMDCKN